jgi:hypothetical protein
VGKQLRGKRLRGLDRRSDGKAGREAIGGKKPEFGWRFMIFCLAIPDWKSARFGTRGPFHVEHF